MSTYTYEPKTCTFIYLFTHQNQPSRKQGKVQNDKKQVLMHQKITNISVITKTITYYS
jgi:hypothetical protein